MQDTLLERSNKIHKPLIPASRAFIQLSPRSMCLTATSTACRLKLHVPIHAIGGQTIKLALLQPVVQQSLITQWRRTLPHNARCDSDSEHAQRCIIIVKKSIRAGSISLEDPIPCHKMLGIRVPQYNYDIGDPSIKIGTPLVRVHDNNIAGYLVFMQSGLSSVIQGLKNCKILRRRDLPVQYGPYPSDF